MLKKAFKVGSTAGIGTVGVLGLSGDSITPAFFSGLGSAILTAVINYLSETLKNR